MSSDYRRPWLSLQDDNNFGFVTKYIDTCDWFTSLLNFTTAGR